MIEEALAAEANLSRNSKVPAFKLFECAVAFECKGRVLTGNAVFELVSECPEMEMEKD